MSDLQILALVRFAYPGLGAFQTEHDTVGARMAHLWAPDRMRARLRSLEHICLRTLARQTDPDFRILVLTGDTLPDPWRSELVRIVGAVPQADLIFFPPMHQREAYQQMVRPHIQLGGPPVLQFRHDDDDGVALDFVETCRSVFGDIRDLWERTGRITIDFNRGYAFCPTPDGPFLEEQTRPHLGVAQAVVLRPRQKKTALNFPHHRLGVLMPSVTLPKHRMWLRGVDGTNDSRVKREIDRLIPATDEQCEELESRFGLDLGALARSFG